MNRDPKAWTRLGQLIRDARVQRNLSREELAERAGVADRSVYSAEVGYGTKPPMRMSPPPTLVKIVAALGWEPSCIPTVLDGGNPIPVGQPAPEARPIEPATPGEDQIFTESWAQDIWKLDLPVEERVAAIRALMDEQQERRTAELDRAIDTEKRRRSAG